MPTGDQVGEHGGTKSREITAQVCAREPSPGVRAQTSFHQGDHIAE